MGTASHRRSFGSRAKRFLAVGLACTLLAGCGYRAGRWYRQQARAQDHITVTVRSGPDDRPVEVTGPADVATVLAEAGVSLQDGKLTAVTSGEVIDPHHAPPVILVDDRAATPKTRVVDGSVVEVSHGVDSVERVVTVELPGEGTAPVTDVMQHVMVPGRSGGAIVTRGAQSGEVVSHQGVVGTKPPARRTDKVVALTFDDGPGPGPHTQQVLDILRDKGVKATFCPIGAHVDQFPFLAKRVVDEGHLLCNHTYSHDQNLGGEPPPVVGAEMDRGNAAIFAATGVVPRFYRPPAGSVSPTVLAEAHARGQQVLKWSVETDDYDDHGVEHIIQRATTDIPNGGIVLFHDGGGDRTNTVKALPVVIDRLRAQGFTFVLPESTLPAPSGPASAALVVG